LLWWNQVHPLTLHHPSSRSATSIKSHVTMRLLTCHLHGCLQLKQGALGQTAIHVPIHRACCDRRVQYANSLSCSPAAHAHACSVRALAISVIKLVGRQKHHHHPGQPVITCLLIKLTPNGIVLSFHFLIIIMTLSLFIGWHGSSKRGAWQLCRPRGRPSSLAQAWGCQVAFSKDHVSTMSVPCQDHVSTIPVPCQDHVSIHYC